jgi:hypothetical protein
MSQRHAPRHRHGHHHRPHPRRPRHHDIYAAKRQGQTLAMLAVAGLGLVLLVGLVALVEGGRDGFRHGGGALLDEPWK